MRTLILLSAMVLPWPLKRFVLNRFLGFQIARSAKIGLSWLGMRHLKMSAGSRIGHFNLFKNLDLVELGEYSEVCRFNKFTCISSRNADHYQHIAGRVTSFRMGKQSNLTMGHILDCNCPIKIGNFTTIAGYRSQFLTHSVDLAECRQDARPIEIGDFCFISTSSIILGGSVLPNRCVLAAGSVLREAFPDTGCLYAGVPAKLKKRLPKDTQYWQRKTGWIA